MKHLMLFGQWLIACTILLVCLVVVSVSLMVSFTAVTGTDLSLYVERPAAENVEVMGSDGKALEFHVRAQSRARAARYGD
ncbi:MAG: hypothetical protein EA397_19390 [Deltaproteobacteria bacterium]|nr:MAG: hypothetical protein EA397_19390 [Deltaproteobacteria bacterium]